MGYTNYYKTPAKLDSEKFKTLSEELKTIAGLLPDRSKSADCQIDKSIVLADGDGNGKPKFTDDIIIFNGENKDDMSHETFIIERENKEARTDETGLIFEFTKTNRKPYDLMVKISMLRLKHHFPQTEISCDGGAEDWKQAKEIYKKAFKENAPKTNR